MSKIEGAKYVTPRSTEALEPPAKNADARTERARSNAELQKAAAQSSRDDARTLAKTDEARGLIAKGNSPSGPTAKGASVGARFVSAAEQLQLGAQPMFPQIKQSDLAVLAGGTASTWTSFDGLSWSELKSISFLVPKGEALQFVGTNGKTVKVPGPTEISADAMWHWSQNSPSSFRQAFKGLLGRQARLNPENGELEFNPFLVEARSEWVSGSQAQTHKEIEEQAAREERLTATDQDGGRQHENDGDGDQDDKNNAGSDASEPLTVENQGTRQGLRHLVVLTQDASQFLPKVPQDYGSAVRGTILPDMQSIGQALMSGSAAMSSTATTATGTSTQSGGSSLSDIFNNPGMSIEDKIFMFMLTMSDDYEKKLRDKMDETAKQEQTEAEREAAEAASDSASSSSPGTVVTDSAGTATDGKSSTVMMQEVQILMQKWKQVTEMTSNLMKTLHDMAMTPIRNLR
jgi:hypothetical protein